MLVVAIPAAAAPAETPELDHERDGLIERLARGENVEASMRRWKELIRQRDSVVPTSSAAKERAQNVERLQRDEGQRRRDLRAEWAKRVESRLHHCVLAQDPKQATDRRRRYDPPVDWGKIVRKEKIRLVGKNAFDDGEPATMYELDGVRQRYYLHGELMRPPLVAEVGDLVVLCAERAGYDKSRPDDAFELATHAAPLYPPSWPQAIQRGGLAVRVTRPPLLIDKTRWKPIHITRNDLFWAIRDVKLRWPEDATVVVDAEVDADLGGGRFAMLTEERDAPTWILEVPPSLPRQKLLAVGHSVWIIMSHARFDRALKKLVFVAEDLEEHYLIEK